MSRMISDEIVGRVRAETDIVGVVSDYVLLQKRGRNYTGLCPFHNEKTSSFTVTPEKQIFHCFGCGVGGDVFKFIMLQEDMSFPEAVIKLAGRLGIEIPDGNYERSQSIKHKKRQYWYDVNKLTADYYNYLLCQPKVAAGASDYLKKRNITEESIKKFNIGFAPDRWNTLSGFLEKKNIRRQVILELGLVSEGKNNSIYDRFRNRIMFPVCDVSGNVIAFGGRVMNDETPKYLNSPETPVFNKSRCLYGLNLAKQEIKKQNSALIVEGYMDVISLHQHGICNTVASLGTALTVDQIRLLMRYTHNIIISYDSDSAGVKATLRGMDLLQEQGCNVKVLQINEGKDPDEFIRHYGADAFKKLIAGSEDIISCKLRLFSGENANDMNSKLNILWQILPNIAMLNSDILQEEALQNIAGSLNISWEAVAGEFKRYKADKRKSQFMKDNASNRTNNGIGYADDGNNKTKSRLSGGITGNTGYYHAKVLNARQKTEYYLLKLMIEDSSILEYIESQLGGKFFENRLYQLIYDELLMNKKLNKNNTLVLSKFDQSLQNEISAIVMSEFDMTREKELLTDYIEIIKNDNRSQTKDSLLKQISQAEKSNDLDKVRQLLAELQKIL